jgi:hypothetical protein
MFKAFEHSVCFYMSGKYAVKARLFYVQGIINQNRLANTETNTWTETAYCAKLICTFVKSK